MSEIDDLKQQLAQARESGLEEAANHLEAMMEEEGSTDDQVWAHIAWCRARDTSPGAPSPASPPPIDDDTRSA